tara:strand:- start:2372 stop:3385 length:1014 start_codon:yes stop_codon:yes gene_type:complete
MITTKKKLTDAKVKNAEPRDKQYRLADQRGLYLQVQPNGSKFWRYKYRVINDGRWVEKALSLGTYPETSLAKARELHSKAYQLRFDGRDPSLVKKQEKELARERLYPLEFPSYFMEPKSSEFVVKRCGALGKALIAKRGFSKGERLFIFTGITLSKMTQHSLQVEAGIHIHDPYVMGYAIHSCKPNCTVDVKERTFTALENIKENDLITMNYNETEDVLYKDFICECGFCDKTLIQGKNLPNESDDKKIKRLLLENDWHFAKTLAHIPHYYSRGREWQEIDDFIWACDHIQNNSITGTFSETGAYEYNYFYLGKWKYWVMEKNKPSSQQILINKALA